MIKNKSLNIIIKKLKKYISVFAYLVENNEMREIQKKKLDI